MIDFFTAFSLEQPLGLLIPIIIGLFFLLGGDPEKSFRSQSSHPFNNIPQSLRLRLRKPLLLFLSTLTVVAIGLGASQPVKIYTGTEVEERRNIMLVIDVSLSMQARDFILQNRRVNRLQAVQAVATDFVQQRAQDRIGLVVFGSSAFLQAPLTQDHSLIQQVLMKLKPGIAGQGTAVGDGIGLAIKRMKDFKDGTKAIVLVTDGVSNSGAISPLQAAEIASDEGVKTYTIGIGNQNEATMAFDESTLRKIAELTGGTYFYGGSTKDLNKIYSEINQLEKTEDSQLTQSARESYAWICALCALFTYVIYQICARIYFEVLP